MVEDYNFFKDCYNYIEDEQYSLTYEFDSDYTYRCSKLEDWEQYHTDLCIKFKKLINFIMLKIKTREFYNDQTYIPYMNYWLNYHVGQHKNSKFTAEEFYDIIEKRDPAFFAYNFKINAHNINESDLKDMNSLYELYNVYYEIMTMDPSITDGCITKANKCFSLYKNLILTCPPGVDKNFCKALLKFRDAYNTLKTETECLNKELSELPSYDQVISLSQELATDREKTPEQVQSVGGETISSTSTELSPEKNKMIGFAGSIVGSSTVLFSIYLVKTF
ncbi:hypothetical protein PVIIG_05829 [Plasmodium vivax India VII]|uniref:Uncharacterized protein n=1 Tax=Plasmodium vivax India VII TaxID=1077284 RepID=A0A0J9S250_PLAVI|nr:hypothetical protein PVIIG_05829 [Plasmodium vivax India VII]